MNEVLKNKSRTPLDVLAALAALLAGVSLVGVAIVEGWQVFARYVLNNSPSWTEPVALLLMSTAMMCGAALGVRSRRHFGFFMLLEKAPPAMHLVLLIFAQTIAAAVGAMFLIAGVQLVGSAWDYRMAGAPLPQGVVYFPICFGGALIAVFAVERLLADFRAQRSQKFAAENNNQR